MLTLVDFYAKKKLVSRECFANYMRYTKTKDDVFFFIAIWWRWRKVKGNMRKTGAVGTF